MVKLIIGGDFVPTPSNFEAFQSGHIEEVIDAEILQKFSAADFRIFNLECPLCDELSPIEKYGPHLQAPTSCIKGIKALNPTMLCLANNHIMDHGARGLASTLTLLEQNQIKYSGAGNLEQAASPYIIEKDGLKIGVHCCAENEFSIVSESYPGANPFNSLETPDYVAEIKKNCDFVVVLYHGGREHYRYPSPELQKKCRKLAEKGADIIICQHSHCIGCRENYKGSEIVYGQGNFLFDFSEEEPRRTGLLCDIEFNKSGYSCNYIPIQKSGSGVVLAKESEEHTILDGFSRRSEEIKKPGFIQSSYQAEAAKAFPIYLSAFQRGDRYAMQNYIDCEAHHEIFAEALKSAPLPTNNKPTAKFFGKVKYPDGRRIFYLFGYKVFSYKKAPLNNIKKKTLSNVDYYRSLGVKIGEGTQFVVYPHENDHPNFGSEPFLIEIGNECVISFGVTFLTHEGSRKIFLKYLSDSRKKDIVTWRRIKIGNNVFIGCHSIIMPGVTVGDDVVIGAGSIVTKDIPNGEVWAGNPAKHIKTTEELAQRFAQLNETDEIKKMKKEFTELLIQRKQIGG